MKPSIGDVGHAQRGVDAVESPFEVRNGLIPGTSKLVPDASDGAAVAGFGSVTSPRAAAAAEPPKPWRTAPPPAADGADGDRGLQEAAAVEPGGQVVALDVGREQVADQQPGLAVLDGLPGLRAAGRVQLLAGAGRDVGRGLGHRLGRRVHWGAQALEQQEQRDGADHEQGQGGQHPQHDTGGRGAVGDSRHHRDQAEGDEAAQGEPRTPYPDVFEAAGLGIALVGPSGTIQDANAALIAMAGRSVVGESFAGLLVDEDAAATHDTLRSLLARSGDDQHLHDGRGPGAASGPYGSPSRSGWR